MAQSVSDILGCPLEHAASLLEAAGGDVELAIELGLGGGMPMDTSMVEEASFAVPYPHYTQIWPERAPLPDAWQQQRLDEVSKDGILIQPFNGPCGVLAVIQAELWLLEDTTSSSRDDALLTRAIANILSRIHPSQATMVDGTTMPLQQASQQIRTAAALVEVAASTLGPKHLTSSLVEGPHWLCSADLMSLLLRGTIGGTFAAFDTTTKQKHNFYKQPSNIGLLSHTMEVDQGMPVADDLKFHKDVYILHTGDHFIAMRTTSNNSKLEIVDGLKPQGPTRKLYTLTGDTSLAEPAPDVYVESFRKLRVGQPEDIVQANKTQSSNYQHWTFEVIPAIDDPSVQGPLDDDPNEPVYDFKTLPLPNDRNWRCATCYANRFKTMNFGTNEAGTTACTVCAKPIRDAMWSRWLTFQQLSPRLKRRAKVMFAPKLEVVLATLYPKANLVEDTDTTTSTP